MKMTIWLMLLCFVLVLVRADVESVLKSGLLKRPLVDESSYSNINEVQTEHFDLELDIDFNQKVFHGKQTITLRTKKIGVNTVTLDIQDLAIKKVTDRRGHELKYEIREPNPNIGQALDIKIPSKWFPDSKVVIIIEYDTSTEAGAVTWLDKEQTSGKKKPYVYTQCQSIYARSIAPVQDTPSIKATYNLHITSPHDIVVRASGNITHEYIDEVKRHSLFEMVIPVESYLLAIAAGNIVEAKVGPRTYVLSEPEDIELIKSELEDLEHALTTAENYFTPYVWGVYKVLILPPSFPFGGMENPLLTFISPSHIAGDKSSFSVFIHEINHSWFGNLVTNENWSNFWLNEGLTRWAERKVDEILYGEDFSKIAAKLGNFSMYSDMLNYGLDSNFSSLTPVMNGNHPDKAFSSIPYEKGFQFVYYIEHLVGVENFQIFLKEYITKFYEKSITTEDFKNFFESFVRKTFSWKEHKEILSKIDWDAWIVQPGLPPITQDFETQEYNDAVALAQNYITTQASNPDAINQYKNMSVNLKNIFIAELISATPTISADLVGIIDSDLSISKELNKNIITKWLQIDILSGHETAPYSFADSFLGSIGKMSAIVPVYSSLKKVDVSSACQIYLKHRSFYHPIAREKVDSLFTSDQCTIPKKLIAE